MQKLKTILFFCFFFVFITATKFLTKLSFKDSAELLITPFNLNRRAKVIFFFAGLYVNAAFIAVIYTLTELVLT